MVSIVGEPGIGKTALIAAILERSAKRGYPVFSGRAAEFEQDVPFGLFVDALDDRLGALAGDHPGLLERNQLTLLASVFPSLGSLVEGQPRVAGEDERYHVLRAVRTLLNRMASAEPLVLALDDLHWADASSVDLLSHLLHRGFEQPVLLLLASRPAQSPPRLLSSIEEAERHDIGWRIELAPLSEGDAAELLGDELDAGLRDELYRESEGNPFYLEQLAAAAHRGAAVAPQQEGDAELGVPVTVSSAIRGEIDSLSPVAGSLLRAAAVLGDPFDPELAAETAPLEGDEGLRALDELVDHDLIRPTEAPRQFRFRHPIVRRAVYDAAGSGWALAAHGRAARALERRGAPAVARVHHVERSARLDDEAAIATLTEAGQAAARRAPASAARWFGAALRLLPERRDNVEQRLELLVQNATALGVAGHLGQARQALSSFLELSPPDPSPSRVRAAVLAAILDEVVGRAHVGRELLLTELSRLPDRTSAEAAELMREIAFTCFLDADWAAARDWASQSLEAECTGIVRVGALSVQALGHFGLGEMDRVSEPVSEAASLFDGLRDDDLGAQHPAMAVWLGWAEVCTERFRDAVRHLERGIVISRSYGHRHLTVPLLAVQGQALVLTGQLERAARVAEAATDAALLVRGQPRLGDAAALHGCDADG